MAEIIVDIHENLLADLRLLRGVDADPELVIQEALALLLWAMRAEAQGKLISAITFDNKIVERVRVTEPLEMNNDPLQRRAAFRVIISQTGCVGSADT